MLGIGDFSRYAGLSIRMLRHYDERGLLTPAEVDAFTGYRRYTPAQLQLAGRIRTLRDAGCGVAQIAELLPLFDQPAVLRKRLEQHIRSLGEASRQLAEQAALAASLAAELEGADGAARARVQRVEVSEQTFSGLPVLWLRRTVADYPAEGELWANLRELLAEPGGVAPGALGSVVGATYFDEEFRESDVAMAIWREYRGAFEPREGFELIELPDQKVARATHHGGYETISGVTQAVGEWIAEHERVRTGPMFNVYVVGPGREPDPDKWVTEVNFPIL